MVIRKIIFGMVASIFLMVDASELLAQSKLKFKVDDVVEAHSYKFYPPWQKAKILSIGKNCSNPEKPYEVHFIGKEAGLDGCMAEGELRAIEGVQSRAESNQSAHGSADQPGRKPATHNAFNIGDRVDVYVSDKEGKSRGTVVEVRDGVYKIRYDGCKAYWDEWVERTLIRPAATISAGASEVKFLIGSWAMFTPSYPNTVVRGTTVYREYGTGAKAPPLQINADGSYVWYYEYGKSPVKGRWSTDAKIEGARTGTATVDGIIIKDPSGQEWKVYKRVSTIDKDDHITARRMCEGVTVMGTRVR